MIPVSEVFKRKYNIPCKSRSRRRRLYPPGRNPLRDGVEPEARAGLSILSKKRKFLNKVKKEVKKKWQN